MKFYKLWCDGEVIEVQLSSEIQVDDVIVEGGTEYTVTGRRFEGGTLHYSAKSNESVYKKRGLTSV